MKLNKVQKEDTITKNIFKVFAWIFFLLWSSAVASFFVVPWKFSNWKFSGKFMGIDFFAGVCFFIITIIFILLNKNDNRKIIQTKEHKIKTQSNFSIFSLILFVLLLCSATFLLGKNINSSYNRPSVLNLSTTPFPIPTLSPTPTKKPVIDSDPFIDCESSSPNCKGISIRVRKSQCSKITCCQIGNSWSIYQTVELCKEAQKNVKPTQQVQNPTIPTARPTTQLNYYCYDNTYKYSYYTSSGEQCNKDNFISSCKYLAKLNTWDPCAQKCIDTSSEGTRACLWAYSGSGAAIEDNPDLYQQCSNENTDEFNKCLDVCGPSYKEAMNKCNY